MDSDGEILSNYKPDTVYIAPLEGQNAYVTLVEDLDLFLEISPRVKFAIQGFYTKKKKTLPPLISLNLNLSRENGSKTERFRSAHLIFLNFASFFAF